MTLLRNVASEVKDHLRRRWSAPDRVLKLDRGPMPTTRPEFCVMRFRRPDSLIAYTTCGMSDDRGGIELFIVCAGTAEEENACVEVLTVTAYFHLQDKRLDVGHSVNIGQPIVEGSKCEFGLISLPYLDGPEVDLDEVAGRRFLWLIPITKLEMGYKRQFGTEALERAFERAAFDPTDWRRESVVS